MNTAALEAAARSQVAPEHLDVFLDRMTGAVCLHRAFQAGAFTASSKRKAELREDIRAIDRVASLGTAPSTRVDSKPLQHQRRLAEWALTLPTHRSGPRDREELAREVLEALAEARGGGMETIRPGQSPDGKPLRADAAVVAAVLDLAGVGMTADGVFKLVGRIVKGKNTKPRGIFVPCDCRSV